MRYIIGNRIIETILPMEREFDDAEVIINDRPATSFEQENPHLAGACPGNPCRAISEDQYKFRKWQRRLDEINAKQKAGLPFPSPISNRSVL
jgi:hypothetical protein